jgi:hypothetical protein
MQENLVEINCYTDASYAKDIKGSIIGYKIGNRPIVTKYLKDIKNTEAELIAVKKCIEDGHKLYPNQILNIYTDCQRATIGKPNDTFDILDPLVQMHKIKGHVKKADRDDKAIVFAQVDQKVRKVLKRSRDNA